MDIAIRTAVPADIETLVGFNRAMAEETEGKDLDVESLTSGTRAVFEDAALGFYLVAESEGVPVGSLMITREWSDWRDGEFWWIQSVYVAHEARRQGVYRALHEHVDNAARSTDGVCGVRLYVVDGNAGARAAYCEMGMSETHYCLYETDFEEGTSSATESD